MIPIPFLGYSLAIPKPFSVSDILHGLSLPQIPYLNLSAGGLPYVTRGVVYVIIAVTSMLLVLQPCLG
jgi:hypothetical protein